MTALKGQFDVVKELLSRGADPNTDGSEKQPTALSELASTTSGGYEAAYIDCARALVTAGGKLRGVDDVLRHLIRAKKLKLAAFLLKNCLDDSNISNIRWMWRIKDVVKKGQPKLLRVLLSQYCLARSKQSGVASMLMRKDSVMHVEDAAKSGDLWILDAGL